MKMETGVGREMPRYKCHKQVWALKIKSVERKHPTISELEEILKEDPGSKELDGGTITPADEGYAPFSVTQEFMLKHHPEPGGYYVVYKDGYKSFSPAEAFEEGYTRV